MPNLNATKCHFIHLLLYFKLLYGEILKMEKRETYFFTLFFKWTLKKIIVSLKDYFSQKGKNKLKKNGIITNLELQIKTQIGFLAAFMLGSTCEIYRILCLLDFVLNLFPLSPKLIQYLSKVESGFRIRHISHICVRTK